MKKFITPAVLCIVISVIFGTIYTSDQYILRSSANDPLIQLAEDTANKLNHGAAPSTLLLPQIDAASSLAPFIVIYDLNGEQSATSTNYHDSPLRSIPKGVLTSMTTGHHAVTWQPEFDVRLASITVKAENHYVVAARSLRETENRISTLAKIVAFGWVITLIITALLYWLYKKK